MSSRGSALFNEEIDVPFRCRELQFVPQHQPRDISFIECPEHLRQKRMHRLPLSVPARVRLRSGDGRATRRRARGAVGG